MQMPNCVLSEPAGLMFAAKLFAIYITFVALVCVYLVKTASCTHREDL